MPIYLIVLGIEGTGHHLLEEILEPVAQVYVKYVPALHLQDPNDAKTSTQVVKSTLLWDRINKVRGPS